MQCQKRSCNIATGKYPTLNGDKIAKFYNIAIPENVGILFHSNNMASTIEKYRKPTCRNSILSKIVIELIDKGKNELAA